MTLSVAPRSCLSVPGTDDRKIRKGWDCEADEIVLDLEDAVRASRKAEAREMVAALPGRREAGARVAVRVNAARTGWCHLDVAAVAGPDTPFDSIVLPKVESAGDLEFADRLLDGVEAASGRRRPLGVQALIETAKGLANLREIVAASPRLRTLIIGYADLGASLGRAADSWSYARDAVLVAARSAGLAAIDGPYLGVADDEEFRRSVVHARELGFDGKWVIHPRQLGTVNAVFTPGADEVAQAHAVLDALRGTEVGAVELEGRMIDEAVAVAARRVLARAEAANR
ncbi:HpcH/HpaI aldolase/citrate lyase family protein [Planosporangium sp. 12N6]|uniref:HpcH/HpaI aldolase/citrate lyase family protein n=1 Tax=Planosporangium spinosum TaxID=3402278 RepID=UPI003CEB1A1B